MRHFKGFHKLEGLMSQDRLPPPRQEACLVRLRPSSQKGGTIIAEEVTDRATHERRICSPDGYRPAFCPTCWARRLHVHDYRKRGLRAEPRAPVAKVVRHTCVHILRGFTNRDLRDKLTPASFPLSDNPKTQSAQVSRLLHRLHVSGLVAKIPRSCRWRVSASGYRIMSASLQLRQTFTGLHAKAAA